MCFQTWICSLISDIFSTHEYKIICLNLVVEQAVYFSNFLCVYDRTILDLLGCLIDFNNTRNNLGLLLVLMLGNCVHYMCIFILIWYSVLSNKITSKQMCLTDKWSHNKYFYYYYYLERERERLNIELVAME